ncbi:MAG: hypothetical protein FWD81_00825 [Methanomassiliicoccaceae archaeon]|nr:hypothetical protein [Methanomassiliicoccaceae archaeon]
MDGKLYNESMMLIPMMMSLLLGVVTIALFAFAIYEIAYGSDAFALDSFTGIMLLSVAAIMLVLSAAFFMMKLRISVSYDSMTVGLFKGRVVRIEDIHSVEVESFSPMKDYFGWGLRVGRKGFGYIAAGTNKGLRINLRTGKSFFISSKRALEFETAMNTALKAAKRNAEREQ